MVLLVVSPASVIWTGIGSNLVSKTDLLVETTPAPFTVVHSYSSKSLWGCLL